MVEMSGNNNKYLHELGKLKPDRRLLPAARRQDRAAVKIRPISTQTLVDLNKTEQNRTEQTRETRSEQDPSG